MWGWGRWGMDSFLKNYCDRIVVIYPFEVDWYHNIGLKVEWHGYPYYKKLAPFIDNKSEKTNKIALLPGSRKTELTTLLPIFSGVVKRFITHYPEVSFVLPIAHSNCVETIKKLLVEHGINGTIELIAHDNPQKYAILSSCCLAITKQGTVTLELGLLGVPSIITNRTSWITYWIAKLLGQVPYVGLPNLLLGKEVCKELLQSACTAEIIYSEAKKIYEQFVAHDPAYQIIVDELQELENHLTKMSLYSMNTFDNGKEQETNYET